MAKIDEKKVYELIETVIAENNDNYSLIKNNEKEKENCLYEVMEEIEAEEIESDKDIKDIIENNLKENDEYAMDEYGLTEENYKNAVLISKELSVDLENIIENFNEINIYKYETEEDFVDYLVFEELIFGEISDKLKPFINKKDIWNSLLKFGFHYVPKVGFINKL
jgi:hypothetical protein